MKKFRVKFLIDNSVMNIEADDAVDAKYKVHHIYMEEKTHLDYDWEDLNYFFDYEVEEIKDGDN